MSADLQLLQVQVYTCAGTHTHTLQYSTCSSIHSTGVGEGTWLCHYINRNLKKHFRGTANFYWTADLQELIDGAFHLSYFLQSCVGWIYLRQCRPADYQEGEKKGSIIVLFLWLILSASRTANFELGAVERSQVKLNYFVMCRRGALP